MQFAFCLVDLAIDEASSVWDLGCDRFSSFQRQTDSMKPNRLLGVGVSAKVHEPV